MHLFSKLHYTIYVVFEFCLFKQSNMSNLSIRRIVTKYNSIFDYAKTGLQLLRQRAMIAQLILQRCCLAVLSLPQPVLAALRSLRHLSQAQLRCKKQRSLLFLARELHVWQLREAAFRCYLREFRSGSFCSDAATAFTRVSTRGEANCYAVCFAPK